MGSNVAIVRNRRTSSEAQALILEGGFDPVGVPALPGDTLETRIRASGITSVVELTVVPARRRPRVVRTIPARNKTDVPLNSRISVVFSEPVGPTFDNAPLRLLRGTTPVPGRVEILDASSLSVDFIPDAPLAASTTYHIVVEPIRDGRRRNRGS